MSQPLFRIHFHGSPPAAGRAQLDQAKIDLTVRQAGQIIVLFALMLSALIGLVGIAIDVTYAWRTGLEIQRAADAGALAGVVYLPGDMPTATTRAKAEATRNGYTGGATTTVTVAQNPANDHQLDVTVTAQAPTFFVRLFGVDHWTISRKARAAFMMPVPMGSPLAYYGVGCFVLSSPATNPACSVAGNNGVGLSGVTDGSTTFGSLGAWGAIITKGGNQQNGDAYAPANNGGYSPANNVLYDPNGYFYTVALPSGGGIKIFDPGFCQMGSNPSGAGSYGAGDHWIGTANQPVSTYYTLWDTHDVPLIPSSWTQTGYASGSLFENQKGMDTANGGAGGTGACDAYHNKWWTLAGSLAAGTYEVQVATTNPGNASINANTNAENMFSIEAFGGGSPNVYGQSRMAVYNNLAAGGQQFYMAKVDQTTGAGKTLQIDLFDIGDVGGDSYLQILSPDGAGGTQKLVTNFSYTSDSNCTGTSDSCTGTNRSKIQTYLGGQQAFNNTWLHITIPLGTSYGSTGLWQGGWWQIKYVVAKGNDTTTWSVNVRGNPVHLVPTGP
jgi:hypothetical protein